MKKINILKIYFAIVIFNVIQEFICLLLFNAGVDVTIVKSIFYIKEVFIIIIGIGPMFSYLWDVLINVTKKKVLNKFDFSISMFVLLIVIYSIKGLGTYSLFTVLMSARSYMLPVILIVIGRYVGRKHENLSKDVDKYIVLTSIIFISTVLFERIFISVDTWQNLNMVNYNKIIKGIESWSKNGLIVNFYSVGMRRAIGMMGDPLAVSYFSIPLFYYNLFSWVYCDERNYKRKKYFTLTALLVLIQLLTITRAVIVAEIIAVIFIQLFRLLIGKEIKVKKSRLIVGYIITIILGAIAIVKYGKLIIATITLSDGSALTHHESFLRGFKNIINNIMGLGMGCGSLAAGAMGSENLQTEVAMFNLIIDAGIITFIVLCMIFKYTYNNCTRILVINEKYKSLATTVIYSTVTYFITSFLSPQIWAIKSVILYWFLVGISRGILIKSKNRVK